MRKRLVIFYRNPELGKVKTRLARSLGDAAALAIYYKLAAHTRTICESLAVDKVLYYSDFIDHEDNWSKNVFNKALQHGDSLGARMNNAVAESFSSGFNRVVIIGTDCPELTPAIISEAFDRLNNHDVVLGPAADGGYYLLGATSYHPDFFRNKTWSTDAVLRETVKDCERLRLTHTLLPVLSDVDTVADLPRYLYDIEGQTNSDE